MKPTKTIATAEPASRSDRGVLEIKREGPNRGQDGHPNGCPQNIRTLKPADLVDAVRVASVIHCGWMTSGGKVEELRNRLKNPATMATEFDVVSGAFSRPNGATAIPSALN